MGWITMNAMENPANPVSIRRATIADVTQLSNLLTLLFAQEADFEPNAARQTCGLRLILEQPEIGHIYCAVANERIVGMVSMLFTVSTAQGGRAAWLEDMIVHPELRGRGIGEQLLNEAIRCGRDNDCKRITLLTDDANSEAMRFYSRADFVRSQMVPFRLKL